MDFFDYVRIYDIEDNELCDSLIRKYADQEWEQHSWGHNDGTTQHQEPDYAEILNPATPDPRLFDVCGKVFADYSQYFNIGLVQFKEPRISRYKVGSFLRSHHDHTKDLFDGERKGIPICTAVGVLNDFEGGEFYIRDRDMELKKGYVVVFPSIFLFPHEVKEVTRGIRYSFVTWAW